MRQVSTEHAPAHIPFIAQGMVSNGFLFTAAVPRDPKSLAIPETFGEQVRQSFANLKAVLDADGLGMDAVVKVNVYLSDIANWAEFNEIYKEFIDQARPPARVAMQIAGLNNGYLVELDVIAEASRP
jgi:2-iminobutanoate/2-iminopropanoate deaminase